MFGHLWRQFSTGKLGLCWPSRKPWSAEKFCAWTRMVRSMAACSSWSYLFVWLTVLVKASGCFSTSWTCCFIPHPAACLPESRPVFCPGGSTWDLLEIDLCLLISVLPSPSVMPRKQQMPNKSSSSEHTKGQSSTLHTFKDSLQGSGYYKAVSNLVLRSVVQKNGSQKLIHTSPPTDVRPVKMVGLHPIHYDSVGLGICFFNKLHKDSCFSGKSVNSWSWPQRGQSSGFSGGSVVRNLPAKSGDAVLIHHLGGFLSLWTN